MVEPPKLPDSLDVSKKYQNNPRLEMVKDAWLYYGTKLSDEQYELDKKGKREKAHKGLLVAIVDPVGNSVRHADQMNESPLPEEHLLTPLKGPRESEKQYHERLDEYFGKVSDLGILHEYHDGGVVVARDGTLLGARLHFHARDCDRSILHKGHATRHRAALASSYLNEFIWLMALSEDDNNLRVYEDGKTRKVYDPVDKDKAPENVI
jgi:hypothetical protein